MIIIIIISTIDCLISIIIITRYNNNTATSTINTIAATFTILTKDNNIKITIAITALINASDIMTRTGYDINPNIKNSHND